MNGDSPLPCLTTRFQCKLFWEPAYPRMSCSRLRVPNHYTYRTAWTHTQGQLCHTFASFVHHGAFQQTHQLSSHFCHSPVMAFLPLFRGNPWHQRSHLQQPLTQRCQLRLLFARRVGVHLQGAEHQLGLRRDVTFGRAISGDVPCDKLSEQWKISSSEVHFFAINCYPCYSLSLYYMNTIADQFFDHKTAYFPVPCLIDPTASNSASSLFLGC